ncbi:hypothetical protein HMPREF9137_0536 [Prevotella denticola F0289]|nr:hypothetical protein HMPREF9137_0536 [Prevotella denticola F0289]
MFSFLDSHYYMDETLSYLTRTGAWKSRPEHFSGTAYRG